MDSKKIRIGVVASTFGVGGAENVMVNLITGLPADTFQTETYFLKEPGVVGKELLGGGYPGEARLLKHKTDMGVIFRLVPLLRSFSPHVLFMLDHHNAIFWGGLSSLLARVPTRVIASHSTGKRDGKNFNRVDRMFFRHTSAVVALSRLHAQYLEKDELIDPRKIVIIENGIDTYRYERVDPDRVEALRAELGLPRTSRVVLMLAALRPEKAHEALLEAAALLDATHPSMKFLIAGRGERRRMLEVLAGKLGVADRVVFLGERRDVPELLGLADVLVLPSHPVVETLPLAVLEAMAAGVPVVASAVGSLPDVIEDGVNGRLIQPADADGLAAAIRDIIDDSQVSSKLAERAKETVRERYSVDHMVARYAALFEGLAKQVVT